MFSFHVWTSLIRQKELAKDQGEWNLCPPPPFSFSALLLPIHYLVFTLHLWPVSLSRIRCPLLLFGARTNQTPFMFYSCVSLALHWTSTLLSLSWHIVTFPQQLIIAFSLQTLSISLSFWKRDFFPFFLQLKHPIIFQLSTLASPSLWLFFFLSSRTVRLSTHRHAPVRQTPEEK